MVFCLASLAEAEKGAFIENLGKRATIAYAILLGGFWSIDFLLDPRAHREIRVVISGLKWIVTAPLVVAIGIGTVWLLTMLVIKIWGTGAKQVEVNTIILSAAQSEREQSGRITEEESKKRKEKEQNEEHEKRIVKAAEELARFHKMKQTRSASEAVKTSLEEF